METEIGLSGRFVVIDSAVHAIKATMDRDASVVGGTDYGGVQRLIKNKSNTSDDRLAELLQVKFKRPHFNK